MKKLAAFTLALLMLVSLAACTSNRPAGEADNTAKPQSTEADAAEPAVTEPAATEEQPTEEPEPTDLPNDLVFANKLEAPIAFSVCPVWEGWRGSAETGFTNQVPQGGSIGSDFEDFELNTQWEKSFNLVACDPEGTCYYAYDVELPPRSLITLESADGGFEFRLEGAGGSLAVYPAISFEAGEPDAPNENILQVNRLDFGGYEHAEGIFHDAFELSTFSYQLTELGADSAEEYPELAEAIKTENDDRYREFNWRAHAFCENVQGAEGDFERGDWFADAFVRRADGDIYSVLYMINQTHKGSTAVAWSGVAIESRTGKVLSLADIAPDIEAFTEAVNAKLGAVGSEVRVTADEWDVKEHLYRPIWTVEPDGVSVFVFDGGEGASVFLPASEYGGLFREGLFAEGNYTVAFPQEQTAHFNIDGEEASIKVSTHRGPDPENYVSADIEFNGETYHFDNMHLNSHTDAMNLFARVGGRSYIMVMGNDYAEWDELYVIEIANGRLYFMGSAVCEDDMTWAEKASPIGLNGYSTRQITDPCNFSIGYVMQILGTMACPCPTALGRDAAPVRIADSYSMNAGFTMLRDLEAELIDEDGTSLGTVTVKEGEQVRFFRTDNASYADMRLEDGRAARVYITPGNDENWKATVDGVPVDEIFFEVYWI